MINCLHIERFMDIVDETLDIKPLTVITGVNSAGKSAIIQSILAVLKMADADGRFLLKQFDFSFKQAVCRYNAFDDYCVTIDTDSGSCTLKVTAKEDTLEPKNFAMGLEKSVYYLNANRKGYETVEQKADNYTVGVQGEYLFGTLYKEKDNPVKLNLVTPEGASTLGNLVDFWLKEILEMKFNVNTVEMNSNIIVTYDADEVKGLSPNKLGTAVSYLSKVLIMCLCAKKGDFLMIENPEIHLHPKAQAKLGQFLIQIVKSGVQLMVETQSEHIINKIQYQIFSRNFDFEMLAIYYKKTSRDKFEHVMIDDNGRYIVDFPEGFFDASLGDLMEIG